MGIRRLIILVMKRPAEGGRGFTISR